MASNERVNIKISADASNAVSELDRVQQKTSKVVGEFDRAGIAISGMGIVLAGLSTHAGGVINDITSQSVSFEKSLIGASKALDLTDSELIGFRQDVISTSYELGLLPSTYIDFVTTAGKLGIPSTEIEEFSRLVGDTRIATDTAAETITERFAATRSIFQLNNDELRVFAASVNAVDDSIGGSFETITNFVQRTGASGALIGLTANELAAMGSVFARLGIAPERAGTAMNKFFSDFASYSTLSHDALEVLADVGWRLDEFEEARDADMQGTMLEFLKRISTLDEGKQITAIQSVFGRNAADEILTLIKGLDDYEEALSVIVDEQAALNKLQSEQEKQQSTVSFQWEQFQSQLQSIYLILGEALLPVLSDMLTVITPIMEEVVDFLKENPELAKWIILTTALLAVLAPIALVLGSLSLFMGTFGGAIAGVMLPLLGFTAALGGLFMIMKNVDSIRQFGANLLANPFKTIGINSSVGSRESASTVTQSGSSNKNSNINYNPVFNIETSFTDLGEKILDVVRDNDEGIFGLVSNAGSRIARSFF